MRANKLRAIVLQVLTASAVGTTFSCAGAVDATRDDASSDSAAVSASDASGGDVAWFAADACRPATTPSPPGSCAAYVVMVAGDPSTCSDCLALCGQPVTCRLDEDAGAVTCTPMCPMEAGPVDGRRPPRLDNAPLATPDLGGHFARMAFYEAASVEAFAILARELRAHGAPRALLESVNRARVDEIRHAELASALARRFGGVVIAPRVGRMKVTRTLLAIALENAREGCGRELFGAAIGLYQAEHARDPEVRAFYATIARDELRHASLALRMHAWLCAQLDARQRARVHKTWLRALRPREGFDRGDAVLGIPPAAQRARIAESLAAVMA